MKTILLLLSLLSSVVSKTEDYTKFSIRQKPLTPTTKFDISQQALDVLEQKCNVCHQTRNPKKVFTTSNMDELAPKIYKQVFIKKRMPKGNENDLTQTEIIQLMKWLKTLNIAST